MIDVDYYSSTVDALKIFDGPPDLYLPITIVYLDDIQLAHHNPFAGELLAVAEFNAQTSLRKICRHDFLENTRIFRNAGIMPRTFEKKTKQAAVPTTGKYFFARVGPIMSFIML